MMYFWVHPTWVTKLSIRFFGNFMWWQAFKRKFFFFFDIFGCKVDMFHISCFVALFLLINFVLETGHCCFVLVKIRLIFRFLILYQFSLQYKSQKCELLHCVWKNKVYNQPCHTIHWIFYFYIYHQILWPSFLQLEKMLLYEVIDDWDLASFFAGTLTSCLGMPL